jgi:hypothetical protein
MKTIKTLSNFATALLMTTAMGSAYADETEMTQTHERAKLNLQIPASDFGQFHGQEKGSVVNSNANQNQLKNTNKFQNKNSYAGDDTINHRSSMTRSMQGSSTSGAMTRQGGMNSSRPMASGRR